MTKKEKTIDDVLNAVAAHFNLKVEDLNYKSNRTGLSKPRKIAIYLAHNLNDPTINGTTIASALGTSKQSASAHFNSIDNVRRKPLGEKTEKEIDILADLHAIVTKLDIELP